MMMKFTLDKNASMFTFHMTMMGMVMIKTMQ